MRIFKLSCSEEVYRAGEGDTYGSIAERFGTVAENIIAANGAADVGGPSDGDLLFVPDLDCLVYTVRPLDTAAGIAKKFGVAAADVMPGGRLYIGQRVLIKKYKI